MIPGHKSIATVLVLALAGGLALGCASEEKKMKLDLGSKPIIRELPSEGSHSYELDLEAGQFVRVVVEQQGIDVAVELFDPGDERILKVDSPNGRQGPETVVAVAEASGSYRLRVAASEAKAPAGKYRLVVEGLRAASQEDRERASAELAFSQAEELRRKATKESLVQARERYQAALEAFQALKDLDREADARLRLAWIHYGANEHELALDFFKSALARFQTAARRWEAASTLNFIGLVYRDLRQDEQAWSSFEEALAIAREIGSQGIAAAALNNLGLVHRRRGETDKALTAYEEALKLFRELGDPQQEVRTLGNIGTLLMSQGELEEAADQLNSALEILAIHQNPRREAIILGRRGEVRKRQGSFDQAAEDCGRALELWRRIGSPRWVAESLNSLGTVQLLRGDHDQAKESFDQALAMFRDLQDRHGEGFTLYNLGRFHLPDGESWPGDSQKALEYFDAATPFIEELGDPQTKASNLYGRALALHELGRYETARERLEGSLERVEEMREEAGGENLGIAFFATKQHYYDLYIDVLMHLHENEPEVGYDAEAFEVAERRRGRALLDLLGERAADLREGVDASLLGEEEQVQKELNALERRRLTLSRQSPQDQGTLGSLEQAERQKRGELDRIRLRIRQAGSRYGRVSSQPRSLEEIRTRLLDRRSLLLSYALGTERSFLWQLSSEGLRSHVLPAGRDEIEKDVAEAHRLLQSRSTAAERPRSRILKKLGEVLLRPLADDLGDQRLLIVAEGDLLYLPFAALTKPDSDEPLVERHEIVYLPSASVVLTLREEVKDRQPAPRPIAIFAAPLYSADGDRKDEDLNGSLTEDLRRAADEVFESGELPPLPYAGEEAEEIAKLFGDEALKALGSEASKKRVLSQELGEYQILHFATHGLLNRTHPELSGLVLSLLDESGRPCDGYLRLHEIYQLRLQAELVVLSACQTGLGQEVRGEGMLGLTRGFMYAGVPRAMVSLWSVSDQGTAELMKRFYWALTEGGASPSMALRTAQLSMRDDEAWKDPYYWAPFVLQGEWRLPGQSDDGIEGAAYGTGSDQDPDPDLPVPPFCKDLPEEWQRKVCHVLFKLRSAAGRAAPRGREPRAAAGSTAPAESDEPHDAVFFNGIDALTGQYAWPPTTERRLARSILRLKRDRVEERDLQWSLEKFQDRGVDRRPMPGVDPKDLASSGWGVIFAESTPESVRDALRPLLRHRKEQATKKKEHYFRDELVHRIGDSKETFFRNYEVEPGPAHPEQLPYYLLIVGDPETVPYRFQYLLDMQYAVGRIHFERPEDYEHYAWSVVEAESGNLHVRPEAVFFPAHREDDPATQQTFEKLIKPLRDILEEKHGDWPVRTVEPANKENLRKILGGGETPAFLFTSAHGLKLPAGHPSQSMLQGALVCDDWHGGPANPEYCFGAPDVASDARLRGLIAILFGCFSAGTPRRDNYPLQAFRNPNLAPKSMISPLAQRLMSHPEGGALAVLGHVDRAWTRSFSKAKEGRGYFHFQALLEYLLDGHPIGSAMDWMNERFADLSTTLTDVLDQRKEPLRPGGSPEVEDPAHLASLWRANNDARNFVVLGDPAVRLAVGPWAVGDGVGLARPGLESQRRLRREDVLARIRGRTPVRLSTSLADAVRAERDRRDREEPS